MDILIAIALTAAVCILGTFLVIRHNVRNHPGKFEAQLEKFDEEWARVEAQTASGRSELVFRARDLEAKAKEAADRLRAAAAERFGA